jgi:hypothetical protein
MRGIGALILNACRTYSAFETAVKYEPEMRGPDVRRFKLED